MRTIVSAAVLLIAHVSTTNGYDGPLMFKPTADPDIFTFKIMQIADIHLHGSKTNPKDAETYTAIDYYITTEKADLIMLTGDKLHADFVDDNATAYYDILGTFMENRTTPWGLIFGNHDDNNMYGSTSPAKAPRGVLMETLAKYSKYGMTKQDSPDSVYGVSNYVLDVSLQDKPGLQILLLDTGGGSIPEELMPLNLIGYQL
jgi:predicted MPP superfamily phosphohydrolase